MKKIVLILFLLIVGNLEIDAQRRFLQIDKDLRENSERMKITIEDIGDIGRFKFGPYRQISSNKGWKEITQEAPFFGSSSEWKSSQKQHFVLVENEGDTIFTNIDVKTFIKVEYNNFIFREVFEWNNSWVTEGFTIYSANMSSKKVNSDWNLSAMNQEAVDTDGEIERDYNAEEKIFLTNGEMIIKIKPVTKYENDKRAIYSFIVGLKFPLGYEFFLNEQSIGALRLVPLKHMYFWVHNDLNKEMKFILAASATTLCARFLKYMGEMDERP